MTNGQEANEARITYLEDDIRELKAELKELREKLREKREGIYQRIDTLEAVDRNQNRVITPIKKIAGWLVSAVAGVVSYILARSVLSWMS